MTQISINLFPSDILKECFRCLPIKINAQNRVVCKLWNQCCSIVIKEQLITEHQTDLKAKSVNFLKVVDGKFEEYFPLFKNLWLNRENKSIQEIAIACNEYVTKIKVVFMGTHKIDPTDTEIPPEKKDLAGKAFASFLLREDVETDLTEEKDPEAFDFDDEDVETFFTSSGFIYYPIELFQLEIENQKLKGEIDQGSHCLPIKGKIFELIFCPTPNQSNVRQITETTLLDLTPYQDDEFYNPQLEPKPEINPLKRKNAE